jgi:hypothetical protein
VPRVAQRRSVGSAGSPLGPVDHHHGATEKCSDCATSDRRRNAEFEHREPRSGRVDIEANNDADDRSSATSQDHSDKRAAPGQRLRLEIGHELTHGKCVPDCRGPEQSPQRAVSSSSSMWLACESPEGGRAAPSVQKRAWPQAGPPGHAWLSAGFGLLLNRRNRMCRR